MPALAACVGGCVSFGTAYTWLASRSRPATSAPFASAGPADRDGAEVGRAVAPSVGPALGSPLGATPGPAFAVGVPVGPDVGPGVVGPDVGPFSWVPPVCVGPFVGPVDWVGFGPTWTDVNDDPVDVSLPVTSRRTKQLHDAVKR